MGQGKARRKIVQYEFAVLPYDCGDRAWLRGTRHQQRPRRAPASMGSVLLPLCWQFVGGKMFYRCRRSVRGNK